MKKFFALLVLCGLLLGCGPNSFICLHKSEATTILNAVIVGATALAAILPAGSEMAQVAIDIATSAKTELSNRCPSEATANVLMQKLTNTLQTAQKAGYKVGR